MIDRVSLALAIIFSPKQHVCHQNMAATSCRLSGVTACQVSRRHAIPLHGHHKLQGLRQAAQSGALATSPPVPPHALHGMPASSHNISSSGSRGANDKAAGWGHNGRGSRIVGTGWCARLRVAVHCARNIASRLFASTLHVGSLVAAQRAGWDRSHD